MANHHHPSQSPAIVMVPLPFQGHTNQLLHLSRLVSAQNLPVYFIGTATLIRQAKTRVHGWDPSSSSTMHFHEFPNPNFENPPPNPNSPSKFPLHLIPPLMAVLNLREPVYEFVKKLSTEHRKVVVIYDFFMSYVVQDIRSIENAEGFQFQCASAFTSFSFYSKTIEDMLNVPPEALQVLNECPPDEGVFAPEFLEYTMLQMESKPIFSGQIFDTSRVIEPLFLDLIDQSQILGAEKSWALGPLNPISVPEKRDSETRHPCLDWLDKQEPDSVIFISFGTTVSFSDEQVNEIALGIERSEQNFIWVLRDADKGDVFTNVVKKVCDVLPLGFEEKMKDKGIILTDWAPQLEILAHSATGGFMSHCGWNSCCESISMGVPIATWPVHSDQPKNAVLITKYLKVGVEVVNWECQNEKVSSDAIEKALRKLMASEEGDEIRRRVKEFGVNVQKSFMEGGVARNEFDSFIARITK